MILNNCINEVLFKQSASNTASIGVNIPSAVNNILVVYNTIKNTAGNGYFIIQTAQSSGIFDTTGYQSGVHFAPYNSNAWFNQNIASGLMLGTLFDRTSQYQSGYAYITDLNTSNNANHVGNVINFDLIPYMTNFSGQSPTTAVKMIQFTMTNSTIASGSVTVYSLL